MKFENPMLHSRRQFLQKTGLATSVAWSHGYNPFLWEREDGSRSGHLPPLDRPGPDVKALVNRALDVAKSSGVTYADVRFTRQQRRGVGNSGGFREQEDWMIGVRAYVDGFWGFAASAQCSPDKVVRVAREAVALARTNGLGKPGTIGSLPSVRAETGHWEMPVTINPFTVPTAEVSDFLAGMLTHLQRAPDRVFRSYGVSPPRGSSQYYVGVKFWRQEKAFGSTEGAYMTQVLFRTEGKCAIEGSKTIRLDMLSPVGMGWELYTQGRIHERIEQACEKFAMDLTLPMEPVDIGRYHSILDAESIARCASGTLGAATELDRAFGYEANSSGTSYLNMPREMIGNFSIGVPALTVTANRHEPGGVSTVQWDDEGIRPKECTIIDKGILSAFQGMREAQGWLPVSTLSQSPVMVGCAYAMNADEEPLVQTANLQIQPQQSSGNYETMIGDMDDGIAFENLTVDVDFQQLNGLAIGNAYRIRKGKKIARLQGAGILFRAPELWNSIIRIGGETGVRRFGVELGKGDPYQHGYHSVSAPPIVFKDLSVIDVRRK